MADGPSLTRTKTAPGTSAALGLAIVLAGSVGWSQTPDADDSKPTPKPVFYETATVEARPVESASAAVTVVDGGDLEASEARSATDALQAVPGLSLLSSGGRAGVTNVFVRGGDSNFTLVLLDGIPLNDSTDLNGGTVNLEELPADLIDHVEVVRGPLTSFYGPGSLSGVVQLFERRGGPGPLRLDVAAEGGNASLRHGVARVAGGAGRGGYSGGAAWDQEEHRIGEDRFRAFDAWGTRDLCFGETSAIDFTGRFSSGTADDYPDTSGGPVYGSGALRHTDRQDVALTSRAGWGKGRRSHVTLGVSRRDLDRTSPEVGPLVPASAEHTEFTRLRVAYEAPLVSRPQTTVDVGVSGEGEWGVNRSVLHLPAYLGGDTPGDYRHDRMTGGAYLGVRRQAGRVLLEGALRADAAGDASLQANPHVGLVWSVDSAGDTRLRASFGRASKLPSFFALSSPRALGGNPDLAPERVLGGDVALERAFLSRRLEASVGYFRQEYRDLVDFDFDVFQLVNRSRVRAEGAEVVVRWQGPASFYVEGRGTWLQAQELSGAPLLHRPRWSGGGAIGWRPRTRASLQVQWRGVSSSLDEQLTVPDRGSVAGYGVLGAAGSFGWGRHWSVRARLDNAANRDYETLIGFPGAGRSFWLGLAWGL